MSAGSVIKSTKGLDQRVEPEMNIPPEPPMAVQLFDFSDNPEKEDYVLNHAPQILSALIIRREGTKPAELVGKAIDAASSIYDRVKRPTNKYAEN